MDMAQFTMDSELDKLAAWTREIVRDMDDDATRKALRGIALEFARRVIRRTPVDTGRARAGWSAILDAHGIPIPGGKGSAKGRSESGFSETDRSVEIVNGVPYIVALEFGHSKQAPSGMVRVTVSEMTGEADRIGLDEVEAAIKRADRKARIRGG